MTFVAQENWNVSSINFFNSFPSWNLMQNCKLDKCLIFYIYLFFESEITFVSQMVPSEENR